MESGECRGIEVRDMTEIRFAEVDRVRKAEMENHGSGRSNVMFPQPERMRTQKWGSDAEVRNVFESISNGTEHLFNGRPSCRHRKRQGVDWEGRNGFALRRRRQK